MMHLPGMLADTRIFWWLECVRARTQNRAMQYRCLTARMRLPASHARANPQSRCSGILLAGGGATWHAVTDGRYIRQPGRKLPKCFVARVGEYHRGFVAASCRPRIWFGTHRSYTLINAGTCIAGDPSEYHWVFESREFQVPRTFAELLKLWPGCEHTSPRKCNRSGLSLGCLWKPSWSGMLRCTHG
jgi:hypothetical protein